MNTFTANSAAQWRAWLAEHGESETEVWLVIHHKDSGTPSPRYHEAIEQALCPAPPPRNSSVGHLPDDAAVGG